MTIKKNCVVCGKEIEVANPCHCLCSDECRKARRKQLYEKYKNSPEYEDKLRLYNARWLERSHKNPKVIPCKICGENVPPTFRENRMSRSHYHEDCVLSEAIKAIQEGCKFNDKRIRRAWNTYGYTMSEIVETITEGRQVCPSCEKGEKRDEE